MTHDEVVDMKDFNEWWNADIIRSSPFRRGSPKYWGWAAWQAAAKAEREACADIADRLPRIYRETEEAHYRLSPEPFKPSQFGVDYAELRQAESITHAIRARGQA
jgi:hypothetical protein